MHLPILAGPRRRTRRALLAAALPAALAAAALPAAADAAAVRVIPGTGGIVNYEADPGEVNNLRVSFTAAGLVFDDIVPIRSLSSACRIDSAGNGVCPGSAPDVGVFTGDRNDTIQYTAPHSTFVVAGDGTDTILAGTRQAGFGRQIEPAMYRGKDSVLRGQTPDPFDDTVSYRLATSGVRVDLADQGDASTFSDGRPGIDREQIERDIEIIEGSNFDDPQLFGSDRDETFRGLNGNDLIGTGGGSDIIDEGPAPNGADFLNGGNGANDLINYGNRTSGGVNVSLEGVRNDGAPGENDDVRQSVENIQGSNFGDKLIGNGLANNIEALGGDDTIEARGGNDTLFGNSGTDTIFGEAGNDTLFARDGAFDFGSCGSESGTVFTDSRDSFSGCEDGGGVGKLRVAPKAVQAEAGQTARLRLSWRHPQAWRKLRKVELRLTRDHVPVGEITIRPRSGRIAADGVVQLVRKQTRLGHRGKTVTARLALRLDESLAGQTLKAEVEATDRRGRRQLERDAARVRVGG